MFHYSIASRNRKLTFLSQIIQEFYYLEKFIFLMQKCLRRDEINFLTIIDHEVKFM